jgi:glycosyltransferase involved in cell wall biosynthesis
MDIVSDFSVLIAVYRRDDPSLLHKALTSIFLNSLQPLEVVVVADGELTVGLLSVLECFLGKYPLRLVQLHHNVGLASALNAGLSSIQTKYTVRADADDFNHPDRFEILVARLREGFDLVGSAIREVDRAGVEVAFRSCPLAQDEIMNFVRKRNPFNHMTVGYRTQTVVEAGGYPLIYLKEDYALWATLLSRGCRVCNLEAALVDATAGREMFRRRGGLRYAVAEIDLQHHLVRRGLKSIFSAIVDGALRATVFLAPNIAREFIYLRFLRVVGKTKQ